MSGLVRRITARLIGHAADVMTPARRQWIRAMRAELDHIPGRFDAFIFALGCVQASYSQRIVDMITLALMTRWTLAGLALVWAGFSALAAVLVTLIKTQPGIRPADLGSDPGAEETLRFIQSYPAWEIAVFALVAALLAAGAVLLVRRRPRALPFLVLAVGVATVLTLLDLRLPDATAIRPMGSAAALLVPILCLVPVWWLSRRAPDLKTAA